MLYVDAKERRVLTHRFHRCLKVDVSDPNDDGGRIHSFVDCIYASSSFPPVGYSRLAVTLAQKHTEKSVAIYLLNERKTLQSFRLNTHMYVSFVTRRTRPTAFRVNKITQRTYLRSALSRPVLPQPLLELLGESLLHLQTRTLRRRFPGRRLRLHPPHQFVSER